MSRLQHFSHIKFDQVISRLISLELQPCTIDIDTDGGMPDRWGEENILLIRKLDVMPFRGFQKYLPQRENFVQNKLW